MSVPIALCDCKIVASRACCNAAREVDANAR
jgi:hypothetical protein